MDSLYALLNDEDYVLTRRFDNSLKRITERYPEGAPDRIIALALGMEEAEIEPMYQKIIEKLKKMVGAKR